MRCLPGGIASWDGNTDDLVVQSFANRPQPRNRCCQPGESPFETARRDPSIRFDVSAKVADPAYVDATSSQSRAGLAGGPKQSDTLEEDHVPGESERPRRARVPRLTRSSSLMDGELGPDTAGAAPSIAAVRVLRLNRGAIRVKRRNASRRSDELWVGTGYSESGADDDVALYLRIGTARHIVAELVCAVIGRAIGLPVPEPLIVKIRKGDLPTSRLIDHEADATLAFASASVGGDSCAQLLREDSEHALRLVMTWRQLLPTTAFDEWMANPDRNLGNIVFAAQNLWLIDHAQALGGKAAELSSLKSLQQHAFSNVLANLIESAFVPADRADHLKRVQRWLNDNTLALDLEEAVAATGVRRWHTKRERAQLLDFVRNRLLITHSLLCNRLGHPQLNLPNPGE